MDKLLVQFVHGFKYLGHIINTKLTDNDNDIQRETCNLFIRTNILGRKFRIVHLMLMYFCLKVMVFTCMTLVFGLVTA